MQLLAKLKEALFSVLPVMALVLILNFTPLVNLTTQETLYFIVASILLIIAIGLFTMGADIAMTPMGKYVGSGLTKKGKIPLLLLVCFILGLLVTIAEPDLQVLSRQVAEVMNGTLLILVVGLGVGAFLVVAVWKIFANKALSGMLMFFYLLLFAMASLVETNGNGNFIGLIFDSGGVTTGPITVPFFMALGLGIANTLSNRNNKENSFGMVALCSVGSVLGVAVLSIFIQGEIHYPMPDLELSGNVFSAFFTALPSALKEVAISLGLLILFFAVCQLTFLKLPMQKLKQLTKGILYTFFGLVLFLTSVSFAYMPIGYKLGMQLAEQGPGWLIGIGFLIGFLVVLAEPAIHVLNKQVEEVTSGLISKRSMLIALTVGVGLSIALSMVRIYFDFSVMYYLVPGYILSLGLSFFVPSIYTAIAFDSGGVASGPLTSGFILPVAIGACFVSQGADAILRDAFGIVAMVAMTPLITIQLLGFKAVVTQRLGQKIAMNRILSEADDQIIDFGRN